MNGDVAYAFTLYWRSTHDLDWLRSSGFPVIEGIARYYVSRVSLDADGHYHTYGVCGPDEFHSNVTDSTFDNAVAAYSLMAAYNYAALIGQTPNETFKLVADKMFIPYNATLDYHPEYDETQWNARSRKTIKQADTVLMYYPLGNPLNASRSTQRNDVRMYADLLDPDGVAMSWGLQTIASIDVGDLKSAAQYFENSYKVYARPPFYLWREGNGTDGGSVQGAPNFVTGAGAFLQSVWAGYGGIRFERDDSLTIRSPRPLPNSTALRLRGVHFLGARLDVVAKDGQWTVALSSTSPKSAPRLELVLNGNEGNPTPITRTPIMRLTGEEAYVRMMINQSTVVDEPTTIFNI